MRNCKPNLPLAILLLLIMGSSSLWTFPVPFAFGEEEVKKPEVNKNGKLETPAPPAGPHSGPSNMPYTGLAEKNIFHPDRKEFPISPPLESGKVKPPQVRPQVVLYGVTIAGDYQSASVVQQGRALRQGERAMLTLKAGEQIGEYRITKIMPDRIVLEGEGDSFEVLLNDPSKPKQRAVVRTETHPAAVTSTLPGPPASPPVEPPRPGTTGVPTPPRPEVQRPMPQPPVPQIATPAPAPPPTPAAPTAPPTFTPRRRLVPTRPGVPTPQVPDQSQGQGGQ